MGRGGGDLAVCASTSKRREAAHSGNEGNTRLPPHCRSSLFSLTLLQTTPEPARPLFVAMAARPLDTAGPIRVGVVGAGAVSQVIHLPTLGLLHDLYAVVAICDVSKAAVDHCCTKFHIPHGYQDRYGAKQGGRKGQQNGMELTLCVVPWRILTRSFPALLVPVSARRCAIETTLTSSSLPAPTSTIACMCCKRSKPASMSWWRSP